MNIRFFPLNNLGKRNGEAGREKLQPPLEQGTLPGVFGTWFWGENAYSPPLYVSFRLDHYVLAL